MSLIDNVNLSNNILAPIIDNMGITSVIKYSDQISRYDNFIFFGNKIFSCIKNMNTYPPQIHKLKQMGLEPWFYETNCPDHFEKWMEFNIKTLKTFNIKNQKENESFVIFGDKSDRTAFSELKYSVLNLAKDIEESRLSQINMINYKMR